MVGCEVVKLKKWKLISPAVSALAGSGITTGVILSDQQITVMSILMLTLGVLLNFLEE